MDCEKAKGYIVTHTHWDREWRYPIWENRMLLVKLMDELLRTLDTDSEYRCFLLDGQCVVVEDYLQVRPENEEKIKSYIRKGRISVGPWYTLPDLYPLDGECLIRNMMKGIRYSDSLGGHLPVAYESFGWGQISQFPQIYKGFGLDIVIVAKSVSKERAPECEFLWEGADGTRILSTRLGQYARANFFMNAYMKIMTGKEYLSDDFRLVWGKTGAVVHKADEVGSIQDYQLTERRDRIHDEYTREAMQKAWDAMAETTLESHRIIMDGSDSTTCQPEIVEIVKRANKLFDDKEFVLSTMAEYAEKLKEFANTDNLRIVKGELRDGPASACSANALMTRPGIKQLNKTVQNMLLHVAEPLSVAADMLGARYDRSFLDIAVKYMLLAQPHDSINGVTQDKTVNDVLYMLNQALEIAEVVGTKAITEIVRRIDLTRFEDRDILLIVFNPSPFLRNEMIKVSIDTPCEYNIWDFSILDCNGTKMKTQFISRMEEVVPVNTLHSRPLPFYLDRHCLYMETGDIPAGGYKVYKVTNIRTFNRKAVFWAETRLSEGNDIAVLPNMLENEFIRAEVQSNGTIDIFDKTTRRQYRELNYLEDTGDCGDYWIYYPPHRNKTFLSKGYAANIWLEENGPLSATVAAEIKMLLPARALRPENEIHGESKRSDEERELIVIVRYTLKRGSRKVNVQLQVNNTIEDHRLRVLFDTGICADYAVAAGHFTVDRRPVDPERDENGNYWPEMQTLPQQSFVELNDGESGIAFLNNCLTEYEAMNNGKGTLALTLLRGVRNIICTEFRSAGVFPEQKGGQSLGSHEYEYAIYPHSDGWAEAGVYREAEALNVKLMPIQASRHTGGKLPLEHSFFSVEPAGMLIMSTLKKAEDRGSIILRMFNPTTETVYANISIGREINEAYVDDLNENRLEKLDHSDSNIIFTVASNKIITLEMVLESDI